MHLLTRRMKFPGQDERFYRTRSIKPFRRTGLLENLHNANTERTAVTNIFRWGTHGEKSRFPYGPVIIVRQCERNILKTVTATI